MVTQAKPLFSLGTIVATPGAIEAMAESANDPLVFIRRHVVGDWGIVDDEDKALNDASVRDGSRILSAYQTSRGVKIWVITEAVGDNGKRATTTILLPAEH